MSIKEEYAALDRTYCDGCGNSDVEMNDIDDELCWHCKNPAFAEAEYRHDLEDYLYVFGEPDYE